MLKAQAARQGLTLSGYIEQLAEAEIERLYTYSIICSYSNGSVHRHRFTSQEDTETAIKHFSAMLEYQPNTETRGTFTGFIALHKGEILTEQGEVIRK